MGERVHMCHLTCCHETRVLMGDVVCFRWRLLFCSLYAQSNLKMLMMTAHDFHVEDFLMYNHATDKEVY